MTQTNQPLIDFAQEVGKDYKELKALLTQMQSALSSRQNAEEVTQQIQQAITQFRNDLMGGELDAQLDTLKEIGDKLKQLEGEGGISGAILQKFTELRQQITLLEQFKTGVETVDLLAAYKRGKGVA